MPRAEGSTRLGPITGLPRFPKIASVGGQSDPPSRKQRTLAIIPTIEIPGFLHHHAGYHQGVTGAAKLGADDVP